MKKIIIIILTVSIFSVSCKKYLDAAYKNPNLPTYSSPENVLQSCISAMHRGVAFDSRAIGFYTQNFANIVTAGYAPERHGYAPGSDTYGDIWRMHYWNMGFNIIDMIDSGRIAGKFDYVAAAFTLNAWSWVTLADVHGEMPVKQAFEKGRLSFDYDNQNVAYELALSYCDSALVNWSKAEKMPAPTLAQGDLYFFQGNQNRWVKFVNGIKARIYHRYSKKSSYLTKEADSVIKYASLAMASTADDAMIQFNMAFPDVTARNFFGPSRNNVGGYRIGAFPINIMTGSVATPGPVFGNTTNDPRVKYIMRPSPNGTYNGIAAGRYADNPSTPVTADTRVPSFWGRIGETAAPALGVDTGARTFFRNDSKFPVMTYSEMQFLKAEAYYLKGDIANARVAYINGIDGHFEMLNTHFVGYLNALGTNSPAAITKVTIPAAEKATYLADPIFVPSAANLTLKHIMCQKYLSLWGWGFVENWVDMRRYAYNETNIYPSYKRLDIISLYPDNGGKLAERIRPRYNSEYLWNIDALKAVGGFDLDYHTKKVWFTLP
jgi:Starch-binding associating with outer membrane